MIKIKAVGARIAERPDGGPWKSDNKDFEEYLNIMATPQMTKGYVPDMQEAILQIVKDLLPGVIVLEYTASAETKKLKKISKKADY